MSDLLRQYARIAGQRAVDRLERLAAPLRDLEIVHVNSTREGGGVAEILHKLVPLSRELGLSVRWEVVTGEDDFYRCTKSFHNALQGDPVDVPPSLLEVYDETTRINAERLRGLLEEADAVFIHDPQPAGLLNALPGRKGHWIWRCHIDTSQPHAPVWDFLDERVRGFDASIFSLPDFARPLPHPRFLVPPSIDPLSEKNVPLPAEELHEVGERFDLDPERPRIVQVSRFDRFKDPVGVIQAYELAKRATPELQLVLAGGTATDDPEGAEVLAEVRDAAGDDPDVKILLLPPASHRAINALQRLADVVLQKSLREGFGLTVSEAMWKGRPVVGGNVGGIRIQILDGRTGYLVNSVEGAALRIRQLLGDPPRRSVMGRNGHERVRDDFLLTRLLRDHLTVIHAIRAGVGPALGPLTA